MHVLILCVLLFQVSKAQPCFALNCKSCTYSSNETCQICNNGYHKFNMTDKDCTGQCIPNCIGCTSGGFCDTCQDGYYSPSFISGCVPCPNGCKQCALTRSNTATCLSCNDGHQLEQGQCKVSVDGGTVEGAVSSTTDAGGSNLGVLIGATLPFALVMIGLLVVAYFFANSSKFNLPFQESDPKNSSMVSGMNTTLPPGVKVA